MTRVLVTGLSGAGKTTLLDELRRRGHLTVDTDYNSWVLPDGTWDEQRMDRPLATHPDVVVSGTLDNQGRFYDRFDHIVLLSAPLHVLIERVSTRTNNPYGKTAEQRAEIARYLDEVEPLLRRGASCELDGRRPVAELADVLENLLAGVPSPAAWSAGRSVLCCRWVKPLHSGAVRFGPVQQVTSMRCRVSRGFRLTDRPVHVLHGFPAECWPPIPTGTSARPASRRRAPTPP